MLLITEIIDDNRNEKFEAYFELFYLLEDSFSGTHAISHFRGAHTIHYSQSEWGGVDDWQLTQDKIIFYIRESRPTLEFFQFTFGMPLVFNSAHVGDVFQHLWISEPYWKNAT